MLAITIHNTTTTQSSDTEQLCHRKQQCQDKDDPTYVLIQAYEVTMANTTKGTLIIIGGHEDKEGDREILTEVARQAKGGRLVIVTVASELPEELVAEYRGVFGELGVKQIEALDVQVRSEGLDEARLAVLEGARVIFFTGGDQLRITSQIGGTSVFRTMRELYRKGVTIVGTSAGAAAMSETMLIAGTSDQSAQLEDLHMAPGLGFLADVVIDSHFAERGRIGRLIGVVAQNPHNLGVGIDEDTAIIVHGDNSFSVLGSGGVYVVDGQDVSYSTLSEHNTKGVLSIHDVRLHVLSAGSSFDLRERRPLVEAGAERSV